MASNSSNVKKADDKVDRNPLLNIMSLQGYNVPTFNQDNNDSSNINNSPNNSNTTNISTNDIIIKDLEFSYISTNINNLEDKLVNSLYTEILDLQIKQHQYMGKYEGRNHWDSLEIGAGVNYSLSSYNPAFQVSVPLPITKKQSYLKAKYMSLESGTLARQAITKKQIAIKAKAYLQELSLQREYINLAEKNTQVKQYLAELNRLGYEAQQVTLFEYITQQNAFVDSQIELVNSQIKYIDLVALLEETLGESFTKID
ncbi:hypothetical protein LS73_000460 [Helicobacter muridarum]|uniref:Uncharacterized protein n=2 Tax=Helicobacter muridarum TaxID=216 RepID=A0A4U8TPI4_9HELI|nr:hypothetical protein LS73_000460 [Helicobacter muridarum]